MTRDVSPYQKKKSLERKSTMTKKEEVNAFTYDRPTKSATNRVLATADQSRQSHVYAVGAGSPQHKLSSPMNKGSPTNLRKSRPDPNAWKNGSVPHRAYVPPALANKVNGDLQGGSGVYGEAKPDLPQKLVDEFKA